MFNDDVQTTAGVAIASLLRAVRAQGRPMIDFPKQKIIVARAGSAGIGVLNAARKTMARMLGNTCQHMHLKQANYLIYLRKIGFTMGFPTRSKLGRKTLIFYF